MEKAVIKMTALFDQPAFYVYVNTLWQRLMSEPVFIAGELV